MKKNTIICISREFGSGGREVGQQLSKKLGIPADASSYNIVDMGSQDAMFALKAGQIDAFTCCDPYASIAEFEGFGHILGIGRS